MGRKGAVARQPFAEHGSLNESLAPDERLEGGVFLHQPEHLRVRNEADGAWNDGRKVVVEIIDVQRLERRSIGRDIEAVDLPRAVAFPAMTAEKTLEHDDRVMRHIARRQDVLALRKRADLALDALKRTQVVLRKLADTRQVLRKRFADHHIPTDNYVPRGAVESNVLASSTPPPRMFPLNP